MDLCICPRCALIIPAAERCPACQSPTVPFDREHHEQLLAVQTARRMHTQLLAWMNQGLLDGPTGQRLIQQLPPREMAPAAAPASLPADPTQGKQHEPPRHDEHDEADVPVAAPLLAALAADAIDGEQAAAHDVTGGDLDAGDSDTSDAAGADGSHRAEATQLGALAALAAVEEAGGGGGGSSWIFENIGWFLGATLVLAGSLYGVREAWQALGDVPRHLVVVGALLGYHAGFVGVGALLGRSEQTGSRAAGRVLATIGWLLLPVVAVGLSSLVEARAAVGLVTALGAGALTFWTQRSVAARFAGGSTLAWATLPALASMLPVASFPAGSWPRQLAPLAGLLGVGVAARAGDGWALLAAATASLASWTFSLTGAPGEPTASLTAGSAAAASTALWVAAFATGLREALGREPIRRPDPARADALRWIALALIACAVLAAGLGHLAVGPVSGGPSRRATLLVYLLAAGTSVVAFGRAHRTSPGSLHLLAPTAALTGLLAGALLSPGATGSSLGASLAAAALLAWGARERRAAAAVWGLGIGLAAVLAGLVATVRTPLTLAPALVMLAASHVTARRWPALHYAGALFALLLAGPVAGRLGLDSAVPLLLALGTAYGLVARAVPSRSVSSSVLTTPGDSENRLPEARDDGRMVLRPLDDVSLLILLVSVLPLLSAPPQPTWFTVPSPYSWPRAGELLHELSYQRLVLVAATLLGVRAWLDRSALVGAVSVLTVSLAVVRSWPLLTLADTPAHLWSALALGLAAAGALLRLAPAGAAGSAPRRLFAFLPLVRTERPLADGAGYASVLLYTLGLIEVAGWLTALDEPRRPFFLAAAALLLVTSLVWFVAPALTRPRARGALVTLAVVGLTGVVLALTNRLGRPLSPDQTALRLSVVVVILYGASELLGRHGERLGGWLGDPASGRRYHGLATLGLLALTVVLLLDARHLATGPLALLGPPPLFVLGASLGGVLLARRTRQPIALYAALTLWPLGLGLAVAKGSLLGGPHAQLADRSWVAVLPSGDWSEVVALRTAAWQRALCGVTAAGATLALLALGAPRARAVSSWLLPDEKDAPAELTLLLTIWAVLTVATGAVAALWVTGRTASAAMIVTGALLALRSRRAAGALLAGVGAVLFLHAQAFLAPTLPSWTGPALAALALAAQAAVGLRRSSAATVQRSHLFVTGTLVMALLHALAVGASTRPDGSLRTLLSLASSPSSAGVLGSPVFALVLAMTALAAAVASRQEARAGSAPLTGLLATLPAPLAALAYALWRLTSRLPDAPPWLDPRTSLTGLVRFVTPSIGHLTLVTAVAALGAHAAARRLRSSGAANDGERAGHARGRDLALLGVLCLASWHVATSSGSSLQTPPLATLQAAGGLLLGALVAAHEGWREQSPRHVYLVQLAVIGLYAVIRSTTARSLPPEADAVFALALGFVLLGVTVQARRAKLPPVERATRLFAALLPLGVALTLGDQSLHEQAAGALASALLYGALAWVERSRVLGTLGAVAVNAALLLAALAGGLDGIEVYLAPLGLFLLALGHLFHATLEPVLRQWLRVLGSLLLYLPAAAAISFQLGRATDARYPLAFGAVCLAGVAAGLALRLRAYLLLGSVFLVLDVIANLVHASLRNHRLGFAILSLTGLAVLGGMVLSTLRREALGHLVGRLRGRLASWE